jgi:hypothetical protein
LVHYGDGDPKPGLVSNGLGVRINRTSILRHCETGTDGEREGCGVRGVRGKAKGTGKRDKTNVVLGG